MAFLTAEQLKDAKFLFKNTLKTIIADLKENFTGITDSNGFFPYYSAWVELQIEKKDTTSYHKVYTIGYGFLKDFFNHIFTQEHYKENRHRLSGYNLFDPKDLLNPHTTKFGTFLDNYLFNSLEFSSKETITFKELVFNKELFEKCWNGILPYIANTPITFKVLYLISNVTFSGEKRKIPFPISKNSQGSFVIPDNFLRMEIIRKFKFHIDEFSGFSPVINKVSWFHNCGGWIEGEFEVPVEDFNSKELDKPKIEVIFHQFVEEAFLLLGYDGIQVNDHIATSHYDYRGILIQRSPGWHSITAGGQQFPQWLNERPSPFKKVVIDLSDSEIWFLQHYPLMRQHLSTNTIESLTIYRFIRATKSKMIYEALLEGVIGLESLVTEGGTDASLQFRLHIAWSLGETAEDRNLLQNICKLIYGVRSKIAHEGGLNLNLNRQVVKLGGLKSAREIVLELFRLLIFRLISINNKSITITSKKELMKEIHRLRIGMSSILPKNEYYLTFNNRIIDKIRNSLPKDFLKNLQFSE